MDERRRRIYCVHKHFFDLSVRPQENLVEFLHLPAGSEILQEQYATEFKARMFLVYNPDFEIVDNWKMVPVYFCENPENDSFRLIS